MMEAASYYEGTATPRKQAEKTFLQEETEITEKINP
jgi:hypothetical protein